MCKASEGELGSSVPWYVSRAPDEPAGTQPEDSGLAAEGLGDREDLGIFSAESEGQRWCGHWLGCWKESHVEEDSGFHVVVEQ